MDGFIECLDTLFDIAHANAPNCISNEDKTFLENRREKNRVGCIGGLDRKAAQKKARRDDRLAKEKGRKRIHLEQMSSIHGTILRISIHTLFGEHM